MLALLLQFEIIFEGQVYNFILEACCSICIVRAFRWDVEFAAGSLKSQLESKIQNIDPLFMIHFVQYFIDFKKGVGSFAFIEARGSNDNCT